MLVQGLRQKECGNWKLLCCEEKKALYRASFCQTFAEFQAPTGEWKGVIGWSLILASLSIWIYMGMKLFGESAVTAGCRSQGSISIHLSPRQCFHKEGKSPF